MLTSSFHCSLVHGRKNYVRSPGHTLTWTPTRSASIMMWRSVRAGGETKTKKSRRTLKLSQRCVDVLRDHREQQQAIRKQAGDKWQDNDLVCPPYEWGHLSTPRTSAERSARSPGLQASIGLTGHRASCATVSSRCCRTLVCRSSRFHGWSATAAPLPLRPPTGSRFAR
jgi:hypothetical protein